MAIPHFGFQGISKGKGQNIIASASYMARKKMKDQQEADPNKKIKKSFSTTKDHHLTMMMLPDRAPIEYQDPETCWNDLNAVEKDRLAVRFLLPLPKELTKEESIALAKEWAYQEFVSKGHVVQLSFHEEKDKNGNFHCHGLGSYRQLVNGEWAEVKSHKAFVDENGEPLEKVNTPKLKNGKLQYDSHGNIKFTKGWQRLECDKDGKPILNEDGTPVLKDIRIPLLNPDGTQKTTNNGKYKKPAWKERKITLSDLERRTASAEARHLWQDVQNEFFRKHNIRDEQGNILQVDLRSYAEQDKDKPEEERRIPTQHQGIGPASELIAEENQKEMQRRKDIVNRKKLAQKIDSNIKVITDYVEQDLKPEEMFVSDYMQPIKEAISLKNEIADEAHEILLDGYETTGEEIRNLQKKKTLSDREQARLRLLQDNKTSWEKSIYKINTIRNYNGTVKLESHCRKTWRGLTGWKRYGYVKNRNKRQAEIYKSYLIHKGQIDPTEQNPDLSLPEKVTLNQALYSVIKGNSVPNMKASYDNKLSAQQNTRNTASVTFAKWKDNVTSDLHTPPATSDFEIMTVIQTVPERVTQLATDSKRIYYSAVPHDYSMEQDHQRYLTRIMEIDEAERKTEEARKEAERLAEEQRRKAEADRMAVEEKRKQEAERLSAIAKRNYEEWLKKENQLMAAVQKNVSDSKSLYLQTVTGNAVDARMKSWNDYDSARKSVDRLETRYDDIRYEEQEKADKSSFWNRYEPNQHRIDSAYADWQRAKRKFDDTYAFRIPEKPDIEAVWSAEWKIAEKHFGNMSVSDVIKAYKENGIDTKKLESDYQALIRHRKNRPVNPGAPADGIQQNTNQPQKETHGQQDEKTIEKDRKGRKPYTGR